MNFSSLKDANKAALNAIISAAGRISDPNEDNDQIDRIKFINNFINLQWGKGKEVNRKKILIKLSLNFLN
jgi:hypothetical protein